MTHNRRTRRSERGFTLAEILVTTAIFAIIMIAALAVYDKSNRVFKSSTEAADMQQSTRIAFDKVVSDLRMAGFDYSRGGTPGTGSNPAWTADTLYPVNSKVDVGNGFVYTATKAGTSGGAQPTWNTTLGGSTSDGSVNWRTDNNGAQYAQPDEQIEFAGQNVVAFRANFDYYSDAKNGNGLEPKYTPHDKTDNTAIFPYVTTGDDEIIIYALKSNNSSKNTDKISFFLDTQGVDKERVAYPPGGAERKITVTGIDTSNDNPPYSLVRMKVSDADQSTFEIDASKASPVAENLRSLQFYYYSDFSGTKVLTNSTDLSAIDNGHNADGSSFSAKDKAGAATGAIGGDGQWDAKNLGTTTNYADRDTRTLISSVRVQVVGMNAQPEPGYTHPTETITSIGNYKQYTLSSLVVPRNLGLTGSPEPSYNPPGQPTITGICTGACDAPVIYWSAPAGGGPVFQYRVESDITSTGAFANSVLVNDPTLTSITMPDDGTDPSVLHYYRVTAFNDNGGGPPSDLMSATPKNATKPSPPTNLTVSTTQVNQITLSWTAPTTNASGKNTLTCSGTATGTDGSQIPPQENIYYQVYRSTKQTFDPATEGVLVLDTSDQSQPKGGSATLTWIDTGAVPSGQTKPSSRSAPAPCVTYYYRVRAVDRCASKSDGSYNTSGSVADSQSVFIPAVGSPATTGQATSTSTPNTPAGLTIDTANSACPAVAGGSTCKIVLNWSAVTSDTSGNATGVDTYRITRLRKKFGDPTYNSDPTFTPTDVSGFTNTGSAPTYPDTTPPFKDTGGDGQPWYFRYTVAAKGCSGYSGESSPVDYPLTCGVTPTISASAMSGSGTSPSDPWVLDSTNAVTVTGAGSGTITKVVFDVRSYPGGVSFISTTVNTSPFTMAWPSGATDGALYEADIYITDSTGCAMTRVRYIQDFKPADCALAITGSPTLSDTTAGSTETFKITYTLKNNDSSQALIFNKALNVPAGTPAVTGLTADTTWKDPDGAHPDMNYKFIIWNGATTDNFTAPTVGTILTSTLTTSRTVPASITGINAGASMTLTLGWQFPKKLVALAIAPDTKLCLTYALASESYALKHCNVVGKAASTSNPTSCD